MTKRMLRDFSNIRLETHEPCVLAVSIEVKLPMQRSKGNAKEDEG